MSPGPAAPRRFLPNSPFNTPPVEEVVYGVGEWVTSDRHGLGRVVSVSPAQEGTVGSIVVDYRGHGLRRVTLPARLHKLDD